MTFRSAAVVTGLLTLFASSDSLQGQACQCGLEHNGAQHVRHIKLRIDSAQDPTYCGWPSNIDCHGTVMRKGTPSGIARSLTVRMRHGLMTCYSGSNTIQDSLHTIALGRPSSASQWLRCVQ